MYKYLIIDIDNTICITPELTYKEFYNLDHKELKPELKVIKYLSRLVERKRLIPLFVTARPESLKDVTKEWIKNHADDLFTGDNLLMRPEDSLHNSFELKQYLLTDWMITSNDIHVWIDDDADTIFKGKHYGYNVIHPEVIKSIIKIEGY